VQWYVKYLCTLILTGQYTFINLAVNKHYYRTPQPSF